MENAQHEKLVYLFSEVIDDDEPPSIVNVTDDDSEVTFSLRKVEAKTVKERINSNDRSIAFLAKHFPRATDKDWSSWQWHIESGFKTHEQFGPMVNLLIESFKLLAELKTSFYQGIAPCYSSRLSANNPKQGLGQTMASIKNEQATIYAKPAIMMQNV